MPSIFNVPSRVPLTARWERNVHKSGILWLTGLSGSGKSTLATEIERLFFDHRWQAVMLDGDNVRHGLCSDLGFSHADRTENIRRVGEVAHSLARAGLIVIAAFISPYGRDRSFVRSLGPAVFHEVFLDCDLSICEKRDPKGLYRRARAGETPEFTGISAPYERPERPELTIDTGHLGLSECVAVLHRYALDVFEPKVRP